MTVACNDCDTDCRYCKDCGEIPQPVLPKCDITLPDGVYPNATITVEDGCIIRVDEGRAPFYEPEICCEEPSSPAENDSEEPCDCPPGEDGESASVSIGQVTTIPSGEPARVENAGTDTDAILDFFLPQGEKGDDAASGGGITENIAGINIEDGLVKDLPINWPPVMTVSASSDTAGVTVSAGPPDDNGHLVIEMNFDVLVSELRADYDSKIQNLQADFEDHVQAYDDYIEALELRLTAFEDQLNECCP